MTSAVETIFTGGTVFTGVSTATGRVSTSVAVAGRRIVAVGGAEVLDLAGPDTVNVDLAGGLLIPGFQDAHIHPVQGGMELLACNLTDALSAAESLAAIGSYAAAHPGTGWILGGGWTMSHYAGGTPTAAELDQVVSDRPVFLPNRDHHSAWVNTVALRIAGITQDTPDPVDGRIERNRHGQPTGALHEGAMGLVSRHIPAPTQDMLLAGLLSAQRHLQALGITAWQDALVGDAPSVQDTTEVYLFAQASRQLTARVVGSLWWQRERGEDQIKELIERRDRLSGPQITANTIKIMQDGVVESRTAAMLQPYEGDGPTGSGLSFVDPVALRRYVTLLDAQGFQIHIHAIGDRAVREALDALEVTRETNGPNDHRHHLAHIEVIDPADVPRFAQLGVVANMQPLWAAYEPQMRQLTLPVLGEQRGALQYPFGDLVTSGARVAAGSDWPVTSANPVEGIHVAVNRVLPGAEEPVFVPHQRISLATALGAYTSGSAHVNHLDETGTIAVGKLADLVVLDRDPFSSPAEDIHQTRVRETYIDGRKVYEQ